MINIFERKKKEKIKIGVNKEVPLSDDFDLDGKVFVLPCKIGEKVYTIDKEPLPCGTCQKMGRVDVVECYTSKRFYMGVREMKYECPNVYKISEHIVKNFVIGKDGVGLAGYLHNWGFSEYSGCGEKKQYFTREEAEEELKKLQNRWGSVTV